MTTRYGRLAIADSTPRLGEVDHRGIDGRTHTPDPAAVARLRAAEESARQARVAAAERQRQQLALLRASKRRGRKRPLPAQTKPEPKPEPKETVVMNTVLTDTAVADAHTRYMDGASLKELAAKMGVPWQSLMGEFKRRELPKRPPKGGTGAKGGGKEVAKKPVGAPTPAAKPEAPAPAAEVKAEAAVIHANDAQRAAQIAAKRAKAPSSTSAPTQIAAQRKPQPTVPETAVAEVVPAANSLERLAAIRDLVRDIEAAGAEVSVSFTLDLRVSYGR